MQNEDDLEDKIEAEMQNELRLSLSQERLNDNNLKIAFIISDKYKMKDNSIIALRKDATGVTLISVQRKDSINEGSLKKVIQYGITRILDLKLKSEISELSVKWNNAIDIDDVVVIFVIKHKELNKVTWKRRIARKLLERNRDNLINNVEVLINNPDIAITNKIKEFVFLFIHFRLKAYIIDTTNYGI